MNLFNNPRTLQVTSQQVVAEDVLLVFDVPLQLGYPGRQLKSNFAVVCPCLADEFR